MTIRICTIAALLFCTTALLADETPTPLPTADELKKQVDTGEYRDALKGLLRVLDLKGTAAQPYNRFELLMLRAECQLQIRETAAALVSLDAARKEAATQNKPDDVGTALALTTLIQRSPVLHYTPKTGSGPIAKKPIDILDRTARIDAYKALFADELPAAQQKVHSAETTHSMPPILDAAKSAAVLRAVEKAGTGDDAQTKQLCNTLTTQAKLLLTSSENQFTAKIDAISNAANSFVFVPILQYDPVSGRSNVQQVRQRRGLDGPSTQELKTIQQTCTQIIGAASDLALAFATPDDSFKQIGTTADTLRTKVTSLLNENFANAPR